MIRKVLVPLDGSPLAERALAPAARIAEGVRGGLVLLHAVSPAGWFSMSGSAFVARERRHSAEHLARLAERLGVRGIGIQERVVTGEPSRAIVAAAAREGVDLIAMSSHGRSGSREWAFGSVAERTLRISPRPVLVQRGRASSNGSIRRVLLALDDTEKTLGVVPAAADLAEAVGAELVLTHAGRKFPMTVERARALAKRRKIACRLRLLAGEPAAAILSAAEEEKADVVAFSVAGRTRHDRLFLGSVAEEVLRRADLPLLVGRASA